MKIEIKFDRDKIMKLAQQQKSLMEKAVEETIEETSGKDQIQKGYLDSQLKVRSSYLYFSFLVERTKTKLRVYSNVVYSRIQDMGGWAGRNHASYIPPTDYFKKGVAHLKKDFMIKLRQKIKDKLKK